MVKTYSQVIRPLENRGILLKVATKTITSQEWGFLNFLRPLMTAVLPLIKNVYTLLAKSMLVSLGLTAASSATDAANQKKIFGLGTTTLVFSIMKTVKFLEESVLLIKFVCEKNKNEAKKQKDGLLGTLLGILGAGLCYGKIC